LEDSWQLAVGKECGIEETEKRLGVGVVFTGASVPKPTHI